MTLMSPKVTKKLSKLSVVGPLKYTGSNTRDVTITLDGYSDNSRHVDGSRTYIVDNSLGNEQLERLTRRNDAFAYGVDAQTASQSTNSSTL